MIKDMLSTQSPVSDQKEKFKVVMFLNFLDEMVVPALGWTGVSSRLLGAGD